MNCIIQSKIFNMPLKLVNLNSIWNPFLFQLPLLEKYQKYPQYNAINEPDENKEQKIISKKRGRKNKIQDKEDINEAYVHNKYSNDNVKRKLKTLFHNYIIELLNNLMSQYYRGVKMKFVKVNSKITKDIGIEYNRNLLKKQIKNIIIDASDKYQNKNNNKDCIKFIEEQKDNEDILKILNMTYGNLYTNYYLKSIKNDKINISAFKEHKEKILQLYGKEYFDIFIYNANNFIDFFTNGKKRKSRKRNKFDVLSNSSENVETTNTNEIDKIENYYLSKNMVSISTQTDICNINTKIITFA